MCSAAHSLCWAQPCYRSMQLIDKQAFVALPLHRRLNTKEDCQVKVIIGCWEYQCSSGRNIDSPAFTWANLAPSKCTLCCFKQTRRTVCAMEKKEKGGGGVLACLKGWALMRNGRKHRRQAPLSYARFRAGRQHSRPLTEHVLWECPSAGMHSASGQIPKHIQPALVAVWWSLFTGLLTC